MDSYVLGLNTSTAILLHEAHRDKRSKKNPTKTATTSIVYKKLLISFLITDSVLDRRFAFLNYIVCRNVGHSWNEDDALRCCKTTSSCGLPFFFYMFSSFWMVSISNCTSFLETFQLIYTTEKHHKNYTSSLTQKTKLTYLSSIPSILRHGQLNILLKDVCPDSSQIPPGMRIPELSQERDCKCFITALTGEAFLMPIQNHYFLLCTL